mmetsp:Transcript_107128/g.299905  ORF Transcript_107128/g.299905 Transcript_107128/m.299905 type:complete len:344 (-) Transcript_107128:209-1240(-)
MRGEVPELRRVQRRGRAQLVVQVVPHAHRRARDHLRRPDLDEGGLRGDTGEAEERQAGPLRPAGPLEGRRQGRCGRHVRPRARKWRRLVRPARRRELRRLPALQQHAAVAVGAEANDDHRQAEEVLGARRDRLGAHDGRGAERQGCQRHAERGDQEGQCGGAMLDDEDREDIAHDVEHEEDDHGDPSRGAMIAHRLVCETAVQLHLVLQEEEAAGAPGHEGGHAAQRHLLRSENRQGVDGHRDEVRDDLEGRNPELQHVHVEVAVEALERHLLEHGGRGVGNHGTKEDYVEDDLVPGIRAATAHRLRQHNADHDDTGAGLLEDVVPLPEEEVREDDGRGDHGL